MEVAEEEQTVPGGIGSEKVDQLGAENRFACDDQRLFVTSNGASTRYLSQAFREATRLGDSFRTEAMIGLLVTL